MNAEQSSPDVSQSAASDSMKKLDGLTKDGVKFFADTAGKEAPMNSTGPKPVETPVSTPAPVVTPKA